MTTTSAPGERVTTSGFGDLAEAFAALVEHRLDACDAPAELADPCRIGGGLRVCAEAQVEQLLLAGLDLELDVCALFERLEKVVDISANLGTTSEGIMLKTTGNVEEYYAVVFGSYGAFSTAPYSLRVESSTCN